MDHESHHLIYCIPDLARLLGCTDLAARRMIERGQIPSRRLGRRVIVLAEELKECLHALPRRARELSSQPTEHDGPMEGGR